MIVRALLSLTSQCWPGVLVGTFAEGRSGKTAAMFDALERIVVKADEDVVFRHGEVRLDEVGLLLDRQSIRGEAVFGGVAGGAAMRDRLFRRPIRSDGGS